MAIQNGQKSRLFKLHCSGARHHLSSNYHTYERPKPDCWCPIALKRAQRHLGKFAATFPRPLITIHIPGRGSSATRAPILDARQGRGGYPACKCLLMMRRPHQPSGLRRSPPVMIFGWVGGVEPADRDRETRLQKVTFNQSRNCA